MLRFVQIQPIPLALRASKGPFSLLPPKGQPGFTGGVCWPDGETSGLARSSAA
jgi:hypothetical protein